MALPLSSITIAGFRGVRDLRLEQLGQVNLLVGGTNAGKTSALEAISLLANPYEPRVWVQVANRREPSPLAAMTSSRVDRLRYLFPADGEDNTRPVSVAANGTHPVRTLLASMTRLQGTRPAPTTVTNDDGSEQVIYSDVERSGLEIKIEATFSEAAQLSLFSDSPTRRFEIWEQEPLVTRFASRAFAGAPMRFVTPYDHWLRSAAIQGFSEATLEGEEHSVLALLRKLDPRIDAARVVQTQREAALYLRDSRAGFLPVSSFGDGLRRVLAIALALPRAAGGVLLIDEIETGLHVSMLQRVYEWLWRACQDYQVQLVATTHSLEALDAMLDADTTEEEDTFVYQLSDGGLQGTQVKRFGEEQAKRLRRTRGFDLR